MRAGTRRLAELDAIIHPVSGDGSAGDEAETLNTMTGQVAVELGVGRLAGPFGGVQRLAVGAAADDLAVTFAS